MSRRSNCSEVVSFGNESRNVLSSDLSELRRTTAGRAMTAEHNRTQLLTATTTAEWENSTEFSTGEFEDDERVPLWVPYVILTIFLLILVCISFVRFHRKRQDQNRQRLEAIADQLEKEQQAAALLAAQKNGQVPAESDVCGVHPASSNFSCPMSPITTPSSSHVPGYLDLFMSFSQTTTPVCTSENIDSFQILQPY